MVGDKVKNPGGTPSRLPSIILVVTALQILVAGGVGLRLTNMTAPPLQDPRRNMPLHCSFDMGGEELYAVKWYKDDHEFFRYTPAGPKTITEFPVNGVQVEEKSTRCIPESCDLILTNLTRPHSSGAYRCEVSTEAPAFRLASQTHNVTVAALPEERPKIKNLADTYQPGDVVVATCTSGLGDPKPTLTWYINRQEVSNKFVRPLAADSFIIQDHDRIRLKSTSLQLKYPLDKKLTQNNAQTALEISCVSSMEGVNAAVAPPLTVTRTVQIIDQNQVVNNQKLHSPYNSASSHRAAGVLLASLVAVRWC